METSRTWWRQGPLLLVLACGLALRLWNASTAVVHNDEQHYAQDAMWSVTPIPVADMVHFLRQHPRDHSRLDPWNGTLTRWGSTPGEVARVGHPCLVPIVAGALFRITRPADVDAAVRQLRRLNALVDTTAIVLVALLARRLGGGAQTALLAAALYAVFPPAATYGSLGYLDPFLTPLFLLLLIALQAGRWGLAGIVTGLVLATKESGVFTLVFVPLVWVLRPPRRVQALALWGVAALAVTCVFVDPVAYVVSLVYPSRPVGAVQTRPLATLAENLDIAARPSLYYWLSFPRHGEPTALALARANQVVTPAYLLLYAVAGVTALLGRRGTRLLFLYAPTFLILAFLAPSDGIWRLHLLAPLLCAAVACELALMGRRTRVLALAAAVVVAVSSLLPQRPGRDGTVNLADLLFMNPQVRQLPSFFTPWKVPLRIHLDPGEGLDRRLWLAPGRYAVALESRGPFALTLDGRDVPRDEQGNGEVMLAGWVHTLHLVSRENGVLFALRIRPLGPAGSGNG